MPLTDKDLKLLINDILLVGKGLREMDLLVHYEIKLEMYHKRKAEGMGLEDPRSKEFVNLSG